MVATLPAEIERVLIGADELARVVDHLAMQIQLDYEDRELVVVGALTGAVVFTADLVRRLSLPVCLDFVSVSSYGDGTQSSGRLLWQKQLGVDVAGRHVLLVEDIVDTGVTLACLQQALSDLHPASLATCALLNKPSRRQTDVTVEFVGLDIPDEFVVGYGLDYAQRFRNLPFVGVLRREVYA